jgi:glycosyltransferase involved in cell wall biosynthesis
MRFGKIKAISQTSRVNIAGYTEEIGEFGLKGWISDLPDLELSLVSGSRSITLKPRFVRRADLVWSKGIGFYAQIPLDCGFHIFKVRLRHIPTSTEIELQNAHTGSVTHIIYKEPPVGDHDEILIEFINASGGSSELIGRALGCLKNVTQVKKLSVDVLFVDGMNGGASSRYRVQHIAQGLRRLGKNVVVLSSNSLAQLVNRPIAAELVVFFRCPHWSPFSDFADRMRSSGSIICYDIDDYVFDSSIIPHIDGVRFLNKDEMSQYVVGMDAYKEFIKNSDMVTVSTKYLKEVVTKYGKPAYVVRNTLSFTEINYFRVNKTSGLIRGDDFVVGYYSGTKTHQADFSVVVPALVDFMMQYGNVKLRIVGQLDINEFPQLARFSHRIHSVEIMPHHEMLEDQRNCDLIIAPLEVRNPFCEAKSELKFFEASLAGRPFIASATNTFVDATCDGRFALIAQGDSEWRKAFDAVYKNYGLAAQTAELAFEYVCENYNEVAGARDALSSYQHFSQVRRANSDAPISATALRVRDNSTPVSDVAFIIPDVVIGGGGHRKIFRLCLGLEWAGYSTALYVLSNRSTLEISHDIERHFYQLKAEIYNFGKVILPHKAVVCTSWATAYEFRNVRFDGVKCYFVQDFEPMFFSVGSEYIKAISTYTLDYELICFGNWVAARIKDEVERSPYVIPFTIDHDVYSPPLAEARDVDLLIFARPSQSRRCFELIMEGVRHLVRVRPDTRIGLFGEPSYDKFEFEYENFGLISDLHALAALYKRSRVGLCFSTTNPSLLGYEMIACGTSLVDVRIKHYELNFGGDELVKYCCGTPESIASACDSLLANADELKRRRRLGYKFIKKMPGDRKLIEEFIRVISDLGVAPGAELPPRTMSVGAKK